MVTCQLTEKLLSCLVLPAFFFFSPILSAEERIYRVAVIAHSPPLSFTDENGKFTGFNVEIAHELCASLKIRCLLLPMDIEGIVDAVAANEADFAVVGFIVTPERSQRILFSKPYFYSLSVWLAKPSVALGKPRSKVAVVKGSVQARYAETAGWQTVQVVTQKAIVPLLKSGDADAAVMPMLGALSLMQEKSLQPLALRMTPLADPLLTGTVHMCISPKQPELVQRINAAIDELKQNGRFDRINTQFIPFRLL